MIAQQDCLNGTPPPVIALILPRVRIVMPITQMLQWPLGLFPSWLDNPDIPQRSHGVILPVVPTLVLLLPEPSDLSLAWEI